MARKSFICITERRARVLLDLLYNTSGWCSQTIGIYLLDKCTT